MSNQYLTALSENATRLGMRLQESFSEHTRDLSRGVSAGYLDSAASGGGWTGSGNVDDAKMKIQLDGNSDREKLDAMKRLIAVCSLPIFSLPFIASLSPPLSLLILANVKRPQRVGIFRSSSETSSIHQSRNP